MRLRRILWPFLAAIVFAITAVAALTVTGDSQAARPVARIAPVPSPLAVPPVLERAAQRLERAALPPTVSVARH